MVDHQQWPLGGSAFGKPARFALKAEGATASRESSRSSRDIGPIVCLLVKSGISSAAIGASLSVEDERTATVGEARTNDGRGL